LSTVRCSEAVAKDLEIVGDVYDKEVCCSGFPMESLK